MKLKISTFILLPIMLMLCACPKEKDACANAVCLNGGACLDGTCTCPSGFSGAHCEVKDLCFGVSCKNGGTCINGSCNCPTGFGGADCSQVLTPTKVLIKDVIVTGYPRTKTTGADWDVPKTGDAAEPDIYPVVGNYTRSTTLWTSTDVLFDANKYILTPNYSFKPVIPVELTSLNETYHVSIYDYDTASSREFMAGITFVPSALIKGLPKEITLECSGCTASFKLIIDYVF